MIGSGPPRTKRRVVALVLAGLVAAACGNGLARTAPSSSSQDGSFGSFGCLSPRAAASFPAGGWLPATLQPVNWDPVGPGTARAPSAQAKALAARFAHDLGATGFELKIYEHAQPRCVTGWDTVLNYSDGSSADERIMQLRRPLGLSSFAFVSNVKSFTEGGVVVYLAVTADRSSVTEVAVRPDGLLVYLQVRSATGLDMSGYPTTTAAPPSTGPSQPSPAPPATVTSAALDLLSAAAGT